MDDLTWEQVRDCLLENDVTIETDHDPRRARIGGGKEFRAWLYPYAIDDCDGLVFDSDSRGSFSKPRLESEAYTSENYE